MNEPVCVTSTIDEPVCVTSTINEQVCVTSTINEPVCVTSTINEQVCKTITINKPKFVKLDHYKSVAVYSSRICIKESTPNRKYFRGDNCTCEV